MSSAISFAKLVGLIVLIVGLLATAILVTRRQLFSNKAFVPGPTTTSQNIFLSPISGTFSPGETFPVDIKFRTKDISGTTHAINAIATRITIPTHESFQIVNNLGQPTSTLLANTSLNNLSINVNQISITPLTTTIDIAATSATISGFTSASDVTLATFYVKTLTSGSRNNLVFTLDQLETQMRRRDTSENIANPLYNNTYAVQSFSPSSVQACTDLTRYRADGVTEIGPQDQVQTGETILYKAQGTAPGQVTFQPKIYDINLAPQTFTLDQNNSALYTWPINASGEYSMIRSYTTAPTGTPAATPTPNYSCLSYAYSQSYGTKGQGVGQFDEINGVAVDKNDNIYVVSTNSFSVANTTILKVDKYTSVTNTWSTFIPSTAIAGDVQPFKPNELWVDDNKNELYVTDWSDNRKIRVFDLSTGTHKRSFGNTNFNSYPNYIAVKDNYLWTTVFPFKIIKMSTSGDHISMIEDNTKSPSFSGLEVLDNGDLLVANDGNGRIYKLPFGTTTLQEFIPPLITNGRPGNIKLDKSGNLYVSDTTNGNVHKFGSNGGVLTSFGSYGTAAGQFLRNTSSLSGYPSGIAIDSKGNVLVGDHLGGEVIKFSCTEPIATPTPQPIFTPNPTTQCIDTFTVASGPSVTPTPVAPINCQDQIWTVNSIIPFYDGPNTGFTIRGNFPGIQQCGPNQNFPLVAATSFNLQNLGSSQTYGYNKTNTLEIRNYSTTEIVVAPSNYYFNGQEAARIQLRKCTGTQTNGNCTSAPFATTNLVSIDNPNPPITATPTTQPVGFNCDSLWPYGVGSQWSISSITPNYSNGKVGFDINGTFPNINECGRSDNLVYLFQSGNYTSGNPHNRTNSAQITNFSSTKITVSPAYSYSDGDWTAYVFMCQGYQTNGTCTSSLPGASSNVLVQNPTISSTPTPTTPIKPTNIPGTYGYCTGTDTSTCNFPVCAGSCDICRGTPSCVTGVCRYANIPSNGTSCFVPISLVDGTCQNGQCQATNPTNRVTFTLKLQGISTQRPDRSVRLTLRQTGQPDIVMSGIPIVSDASGIYTTSPVSVTPGTYDVLVKGPVHLQKKFTNIIIPSTTTSVSLDLTSTPLKAGDIAGATTFPFDNKVDILDYGRLTTDFASGVTKTSLADLNLDSKVDILDYGILTSNFNSSIYGDQ